MENGSRPLSGSSTFVCSRIFGLDCPWVMALERSQDLMVSLLRSPDTIPIAHPRGSKTTSHGVNRVKFNCNLGQEIETEKCAAGHPGYCGWMIRFTLRSMALTTSYSGQLFRLHRFSGWFVRFFWGVGRESRSNERDFPLTPRIRVRSPIAISLHYVRRKEAELYYTF